MSTPKTTKTAARPRSSPAEEQKGKSTESTAPQRRKREKATGPLLEAIPLDTTDAEDVSLEPTATLPGGTLVWCRHNAILPLSEVKRRFNPKNPNKHPFEQLQALCNILDLNGWRSPVVISLRSGLITKGHGRSQAAELLEQKKGIEMGVPVEYQNYESEAAEMADLVADNKIAELSSMDERTVAEIAQSIKGRFAGFDMTAFAFGKRDLNALLKLDLSKTDEEDENPYSRKVGSPTYTPTQAEAPPVNSLFDDTKTRALLSRIEVAKKLPPEVAAFLRYAAHRHTVFDYESIAEFYAHADEQTQALMEESALVIVDFEKAIEQGFVKLSKDIADAYAEDDKAAREEKEASERELAKAAAESSPKAGSKSKAK